MAAWGRGPVASSLTEIRDSLGLCHAYAVCCAMLTSDAPVLCRCAVSDAMLCLLR